MPRKTAASSIADSILGDEEPKASRLVEVPAPAPKPRPAPADPPSTVAAVSVEVPAEIPSPEPENTEDRDSVADPPEPGVSEPGVSGIYGSEAGVLPQEILDLFGVVSRGFEKLQEHLAPGGKRHDMPARTYVLEEITRGEDSMQSAIQDPLVILETLKTLDSVLANLSSCGLRMTKSMEAVDGIRQLVPLVVTDDAEDSEEEGESVMAETPELGTEPDPDMVAAGLGEPFVPDNELVVESPVTTKDTGAGWEHAHAFEQEETDEQNARILSAENIARSIEFVFDGDDITMQDRVAHYLTEEIPGHKIQKMEDLLHVPHMMLQEIRARILGIVAERMEQIEEDDNTEDDDADDAGFAAAGSDADNE